VDNTITTKPFTGKVAIVTGAGSPIGLGLSMSLALVEAGAQVTMSDIDKESLKESATLSEA
jgi:3-oxoacyl-[acyl-carrier protein] reductase